MGDIDDEFIVVIEGLDEGRELRPLLGLAPPIGDLAPLEFSPGRLYPPPEFVAVLCKRGRRAEQNDLVDGEEPAQGLGQIRGPADCLLRPDIRGLHIATGPDEADQAAGSFSVLHRHPPACS